MRVSEALLHKYDLWLGELAMSYERTFDFNAVHPAKILAPRRRWCALLDNSSVRGNIFDSIHTCTSIISQLTEIHFTFAKNVPAFSLPGVIVKCRIENSELNARLKTCSTRI